MPVTERPAVARHPRHRLLFVVNNPAFFLSHRLPIAIAAREAGFEVHVATPHGPSVAAIHDAGFTWHRIVLSRAGMSVLGEVNAVRGLYRLYRRLRPTLVHHVTPKPVLYGTLAARWARVPGVVNAISGLGHAFSPAAPRVLRFGVGLGYRASLRHPNMRVIFQNEDHRALFVRRRWVRPGDAEVIPGSGVDVERFRPARAGESASDTVLVVLAARLLATKGVREFVEAARRLHDPARSRFALVGDPDPGNPASIAPAEIAQWVEEGVVEHWGHRTDMAAVYRGAQVACLPSHTEGMPKSLIEAAACGLAIVATDEPGCRAVVAHDRSGLLVPVGDVSALTGQLGRVIGDASLRDRLGREARGRAVAEFAIGHIVARHIAIYRALA